MFYIDIANQLSAGTKFWVIFSNDTSKWVDSGDSSDKL